MHRNEAWHGTRKPMPQPQQPFDQLVSALLAVKKTEALEIEQRIKAVRDEIDRRKKVKS
jgi:hypothetical protein